MEPTCNPHIWDSHSHILNSPFTDKVLAVHSLWSSSKLYVEGAISKIIYNPAMLLWVVWHTFQGSFAWSIYDPVLPWAGQFSSRNFGGGKSRRQLQLLITGTPRPLLSWFLTFRDNNSTNKNVGLWTYWFFSVMSSSLYFWDVYFWWLT